MSSSNCCFLTCLQISQEVVRWSGGHLFKNFPQFVAIHTVKGFGIVSKAEVDVFLELSCFFDDPMDVGNLISRCVREGKNAKRFSFIHLFIPLFYECLLHACCCAKGPR